MATVLVDYENVCATDGLKGVEYLNEKDTLIVFYSQSCEKIRAEYIDAIEKSGCAFMTRKLVKAGKNALDFYIASECGCISQMGEKQIIIISKDKGFHAVADFFSVKPEMDKVVVIIASNIENGLMALNTPDNLLRKRLLKEKTRSLDIAVEQARMQERNEFRRKIVTALEGTEYEEMTSKILHFVESSNGNSLKSFYTGTLHNFGRTNGTAIYRILKDVV